MASIVGKPNLNYSILSDNDLYQIMLIDLSDWKILESAPAVLKIVMPGSKNEIIQTWAKNRVNIINSSNIGIICPDECTDNPKQVELPDGIYQFILEGSPTSYNKKRYYFRYNNLQLQLDKIYIKANIEYTISDKELREDLMNIHFMLEAAEAHTRNGDFVRADKCFCEAVKLVERRSECKNCK